VSGKGFRDLIPRVYYYLRYLRGQCGLTLIETLISLSILGLVAGIFLSGMSVSSKAVMISQKRMSVESVAKSQMEYIMNQEYDGNNPPEYEQLDETDIPEGYEITIIAERLDPKGDGFDEDDGLQMIAVIVEHNEEETVRLEGYKLSR